MTIEERLDKDRNHACRARGATAGARLVHDGAIRSARRQGRVYRPRVGEAGQDKGRETEIRPWPFCVVGDQSPGTLAYQREGLIAVKGLQPGKNAALIA